MEGKLNKRAEDSRAECQAIELPEWLFSHALSDVERAEGYETISALSRSWIKQQIAFLHNFWGENIIVRENSLRNLKSGVSVQKNSAPVSWVLVFFSERFASAPQLVAALMPAILAGAEQIITCRVSDGSAPYFPPFISAALDLLGQENCFSLSIDKSRELLATLVAQSEAGDGRVILLDIEKAIFFNSDSISELAHKKISYFTGQCAIKIDVYGKNSDEIQSKLSWLYPAAEFFYYPEKSSEQLNDLAFAAIASDDEGLAQLDEKFYPLMLGPSYESCWIWQELSPEYFINHSLFIKHTLTHKYRS